MEAFEPVFNVLPPRWRGIDFTEVSELRLRAGQAPAVLEQGQERRLPGLVRPGDLEEILQRATGQSVYAYLSTLRQGFVTLPGGHRIGICGAAAVKNGEMTGYQSISSLCIRFARDVQISPGRLLPHLEQSSLIIGPPGAGKTTLLRACVRALSAAGRRVCVADERGEIAAFAQGQAQFDLGPQTDVLTGADKRTGMMLLLRAMDPEWIAADEITARKDLDAMQEITYCGVRLLATAHAGDMHELRARPLYRELLRLGIFKTYFLLRPDRQFSVVEAAE